MNKNHIFYKDSKQMISTNCSGNIIFHELYEASRITEEIMSLVIEMAHSNLKRSINTAYMIKIDEGSLIPFEDESWVERMDLQRLASSGIVVIAYISEVNVFSCYELEKDNLIGINRTLKIRIFKDEDIALHWLQKVNFNS
jgi:hypothetical protein